MPRKKKMILAENEMQVKSRNTSPKKPLKSKTINKKGGLIDWDAIFDALFHDNSSLSELSNMSDQELKTLYNMTMSNRDTYDTDGDGNKGFFIPNDFFSHHWGGENRNGDTYMSGGAGDFLSLDENGNVKTNPEMHLTEWVDEKNNPIMKDPNKYNTHLGATPIRQWPNHVPDYVRMKGDKGSVSYTDNLFNKHISGKPQPLKYATPFKNKYSK